MIRYNREDFNVPQIAVTNGWINRYTTDHNYYVYGLKSEGRPPIVISRPASMSDERIRPIVDYLNAGGLQTIERIESRTLELRIGLRHDVREDVAFASAVVRTIVFAVEGKLEIDCQVPCSASDGTVRFPHFGE